jgi:crossover junction endodeoxyribonuclease RuvC
VTVLGIDPGTAACGYGVVSQTDGRLRAVDLGSWHTPASMRPELRLKTIYDTVADLIDQFAPQAVAIEESFVGADARTALSVGQARGAVLVAAANAGIPCAEYAPAHVKQAVCGYGRAEKAQVQRMVQSLLSLPERPRPPDAADALALALCHLTAAPRLARVAAAEGRR